MFIQDSWNWMGFEFSSDFGMFVYVGWETSEKGIESKHKIHQFDVSPMSISWKKCPVSITGLHLELRPVRTGIFHLHCNVNAHTVSDFVFGIWDVQISAAPPESAGLYQEQPTVSPASYLLFLLAPSQISSIPLDKQIHIDPFSGHFLCASPYQTHPEGGVCFVWQDGIWPWAISLHLITIQWQWWYGFSWGASCVSPIH